ncbi:MAG: hypothetical protein AAFS07_16175 [Pseudomonadota bacterium]
MTVSRKMAVRGGLALLVLLALIVALRGTHVSADRFVQYALDRCAMRLAGGEAADTAGLREVVAENPLGEALNAWTEDDALFLHPTERETGAGVMRGCLVFLDHDQYTAALADDFEGAWRVTFERIGFGLDSHQTADCVDQAGVLEVTYASRAANPEGRHVIAGLIHFGEIDRFMALASEVEETPEPTLGEDCV